MKAVANSAPAARLSRCGGPACAACPDPPPGMPRRIRPAASHTLPMPAPEVAIRIVSKFMAKGPARVRGLTLFPLDSAGEGRFCLYLSNRVKAHAAPPAAAKFPRAGNRLLVRLVQTVLARVGV